VWGGVGGRGLWPGCMIRLVAAERKWYPVENSAILAPIGVIFACPGFYAVWTVISERTRIVHGHAVPAPPLIERLPWCLIAGSPILIGILLVLLSRTGFWIDAEGITERGMFRSKTLRWADVTEAGSSGAQCRFIWLRTPTAKMSIYRRWAPDDLTAAIKAHLPGRF
jgi:hypothetical protein